jgi:Protein of unknown function (DUF2911)
MKMNKLCSRCIALLYFLFLQLMLSSIYAQTTSAYIFRLGKDTVAYEQFTRSKDFIEGDILSLYPRLSLNHFKLEIGPDNRVKGFESALSYFSEGKADAPFLQKSGSVEDTIVTQQAFRNGKVDSFFTSKFSVISGSVPFFDNNDVLGFEQMIRYASLSDKDSIALNRFTNGPMNSYVKKINKDTYESKVFFFPVHIKVNSDQQIVSLDATSSTIKTIATKIAPVNFNKLIQSFAQKEKATGFTGLVSPVDTFKTSFNSTDFQITYGRPYKRGREIFGNIVPWNSVWRLGANFATHFIASKDLRFGEFTLPAGRYTLWMIPRQGKDSCELIINKAVNIFGTQYQKAKDLVRLPVLTTSLTSPVEQLSIRILETNDGGEINIQWDNLQFSAAFKIK